MGLLPRHDLYFQCEAGHLMEAFPNSAHFILRTPHPPARECAPEPFFCGVSRSFDPLELYSTSKG